MNPEEARKRVLDYYHVYWHSSDPVDECIEPICIAARTPAVEREAANDEGLLTWGQRYLGLLHRDHASEGEITVATDFMSAIIVAQRDAARTPDANALREAWEDAKQLADKALADGNASEAWWQGTQAVFAAIENHPAFRTDLARTSTPIKEADRE